MTKRNNMGSMKNIRVPLSFNLLPKINPPFKNISDGLLEPSDMVFS